LQLNKLAYIQKRKKLEDFEKLKDEFDYDKVYLSKLTCVEKRKEEKNLVNIRKETNTKEGEIKTNTIEKNFKEMLEEKEINKISSVKVQSDDRLQQINCNPPSLINNVPNNFKGLLTIKENKSKRKILINKDEKSSLNMKNNNDCMKIIDRAKETSEIKVHFNEEEIKSNATLSSDNRYKHYVISANVRPFTAPEENIVIENKRKETKPPTNFLKKLSSKIKFNSSNYPSSRDSEKNRSLLSSLTKLPIVKSVSESTELLNNYTKLNPNKLSSSTVLNVSKTGR
jgi:hypothetical protein